MVRVDRCGWALYAFLIAIAVILFVPINSHAQNVAVAEVSGQILDPTGAAVPGAHVTMEETDRNIDHATDADDDGRYLFPNLPVGPYKLMVTQTSFKSYVQTGIVLQVNDHVALNITMQLGAVSESVVVQAGAVMVQTETAAVSNVINGSQIAELPLNGRYATSLIEISGAASRAESAGGSPTSGYGDLTGSKSFFSSFAISVAGGQYNGTNYLLDGGTNVDTYAFVNLPFPFPDALAEFSVETDSLPAQTGTKAGGVVNVVTKSGTNALHGGIFEFLRNGDFNARAHPVFGGPQPGVNLATNCQGYNPTNFAATVAATPANAADNFDGGLTGTPCDVLRRSQFGGTLGGKIKKDKLFYFMGYQGTRISQVGGSTTFLPTQDELTTGDLAPFYNEYNPHATAAQSGNTTTGTLGNTTNYWTGVTNCGAGGTTGSGTSSLNTPYFSGGTTGSSTDFTDHLAAGQTFDPVALNFFGTNKVPYAPGQGTNPAGANYNPCGYLTYAVPSVQNEDQVIGRIDYVVSPKQTIFGRYFIDDFTDPDANTLAGATNLLLTSSAGVFQRAQTFTLGDSYSFSPTTINTLHLTWNRRRDNRSADIPYSVNTLGSVDYTETNTFVQVSGPFSVGCGTCNKGFFNVNTWQVSDDVDLIRGRNHFTMGFDLIHTQDNTLSNYENDSTFTFGTTFTNTALGDFLVGAYSGQSESRPQQVAFRSTFPAFYLQDVFRLRNDLTVNLGLRWEPEIFPSDVYGRGATFNLQSFIENQRSPSYASSCTAAALAIDPNACPPAGFFFDGDPGQGKAFEVNKILNLAPRIGIAWNPFGSQKQVVRLGAGIFYDDAAVWWSQRLTSDPPGIDEIDLSQAVSNTGGSTNTFCGTLSHPWEYFTPSGCGGAPANGNLNGGANAQPAYAGPFPAVHDFPAAALWVVIPTTNQPTYVAEWTASYQFQFANNWVFSASYLGNKSTHLPLGESFNFSETPNENLAASSICQNPGAGVVGTAASPICNSNNEIQREYLNVLAAGGIAAANSSSLATHNLGVNEISTQMELGTESNNANYNGVLVVLQHRFARGFTFNTNYTYSHCFDDGESQGDLNGNTFYENQLNQSLNYGSCSFDIRHIFNSNVVADSPIKNGWGLKSVLLGGWEVAPNIRIVSGLPINPTIADNSLTGGSAQATFLDFAPGCDAATAYTANGLQKGYSWLNQSCFFQTVAKDSTGTAAEYVNPVFTNTVVCGSAASNTVAGNSCPAGTTVLEYSHGTNGSGQFGNIQRNYLRAPGAIGFDMAVSRTFPIHERLQAEFRFEAFNVFNHWNPQAPSFGNLTNGASNAASTNGNNLIGGNQSFGYITGSSLSGIIPTQYDPRVLQFAVKLHF